ncbi:MAG: ATP-binding cassette domain-containing protein [Bdellovibrionales bacterium]|nr:ATP-binding cassette domain-containing protein [Bdellovibrionales bacterium]
MISFKNVTKKYGSQTILDDLNFEIKKNKITTILGFSGAGKSTLLKHILGLSAPTRGEITCLGQDITQLDDFSLKEFRRNFGMVFQYAALFDSLTAVENVDFPLNEFTTLSIEERFEQASNLLISVGITEKSFNKYPSELSGGMRKRVGLARALALSPTIMLYDEPTTGLDPITTKMVNRLIVDTALNNKEKGLTSIIISHNIESSLKISDFIAFLDNGKIIENLPASEFKNSKIPIIQEFLN